MIVRRGVGETYFQGGNAPVGVLPGAGAAADFTAYAWLAFSVAAVIWFATRGPAAQHRRSEIQKARAQMKRARSISRWSL